MKTYLSFLLASQRILARVEGYLTKFKITNSQVFIMLLLYFNQNKPETPGNIAKKLGLSNPTISNVLQTLEKNNYIKKMKLKEDRRSSIVYLSDEGMEFIKEFVPLYAQKYEQLFSNFDTSELNNLKNSSLKLISNLNYF